MGGRLRSSSVLGSGSRWGSSCLLRSRTWSRGPGKGVVELDWAEGWATEPWQLWHPQGRQGGDPEPRQLRSLLPLHHLLLLLQHGRTQGPVHGLELREHEALGWLACLLLLQHGRPWRLHFV